MGAQRKLAARELPPSFRQERLWFLDQLAPGRSVPGASLVLRLLGRLDARALGLALDDLVERHEALRTRLVMEDGRLRQVVDPPASRPLPVEDPGGGRDAIRRTRLRVLAARDASRPFDLAAGPLVRARLVADAGDHVLLAGVHQAVFDAASAGVLVRELAARYRARTLGEADGLPGAPPQPGDLAVAERRLLRGDTLEALVDHWRAILAGAPALRLPTDRPRPRLRCFEARVQRLDVGAAASAGLEELGRRTGAGMAAVLLAAFLTLLHRYTGQDDITVGLDSGNRDRPELASLVGGLAGPLPIRADLTGDPPFTDLLSRVGGAMTRARAHADLPFARLVDALREDHDPTRPPVFQASLAVEAAPAAEVPPGEVTIRPERMDVPPPGSDLDLRVRIGGAGLSADLSYAAALFEDTTARQLLDHLGVLLAGIAADPACRLSRLPLLTPADRRRELVEWNETAAPSPVSCVHRCFEAQVARTPHAVAAVLDEERWTYAELNVHANRVGRLLRRRGIGPETLVGIAMRPSLRRLAAIIGVLKAGGGYVPLDPDVPPDRLAHMAGDAAVRVVLTGAGSPALDAPEAEVVDLDERWAALQDLPGGDVEHAVAPGNVAYVVYTSGSTGRPKGVVVQHGTVVNYLTAVIRSWAVGPADRWLQFASIGFDVSVMDMFVTLCSGATAVLGSPETLHSPHRLAELMRRQRVTFACLPPAVVNLLTAEPLPDLRVLVSAGEALSADLVRRWLRPGLAFCNGYGPTETTCGVTIMELLPVTSMPPPIGAPLPNYRAYVLDGHLEPAPLGVTAELHVGGPCMARGYLGQPGLTADRFRPDPYAGQPGARLYRTGDLVRRLRDGTIRFIGRVDSQVKIHAQRVELGEIEAVLAAHPAVAQAVVVMRRGRDGHSRLAGYVRAHAGAPRPDPAALRRHLGRQLPAYMVPGHLVLLDAFPLTPSGKIDQRALPEPASAARDHAVPRTRLESRLVDLYRSMLGNADAGIDDDFFELGGSSLQAMQLVAALHAGAGVDAEVSTVFLAPTPRRLAAHLRERHGVPDGDLDAAGGRLVELVDGGAGPSLFIIHAIGGTVFPYAPLARELAGTHRLRGVEAAGLRPGTAPAADLDAMVADYLALVRAAEPAGPHRLAGWSMGGAVAFEVARRLEALGEEVSLLVLLDAPCEVPERRPRTESELAARFVADAVRTLDVPCTDVPALDSWAADDQLRWLAELLDAGAGSAAGIQAEIQRRFAVFQANTSVIAGYHPTAPVHAPALLVTAEGSVDWAPTWRTALDGPVEAIRVPGDHWTLLRPPAVRRIAAAILSR
jgi:amino acid adenylation domain-containing protein